jgi:ubiquinone/menaquinone biosynthesis C-methylase UbiE
MDYDTTTIAKSYDAARGYRPEVLRKWLDLIAVHAPSHPRLIVDVGCGTGRFTYPLAERFQARVIGIDPSQKMLESARGKLGGNGRVEFRQAPAERLPVERGSADLVFLSMVLHHIVDPAAAARECRRILRDDGRVCARNCTRDTIYPQARFFPGMVPMIQDELPSRDDIVRAFEDAALRLRTDELVAHSVALNWQEFADKLALRADSFLARLPNEEFETGLAALRAHARDSDPREDIIEHIHFFVFEPV